MNHGTPRDFEGEGRHLSQGTVNPSYGSQKHADVVLDQKSLKDFKEHLMWIAEELDEAEAHKDSDKITKLKEEHDRILEQLRKAYGLGGKSREFSDPGEKARKSVQAAVSRSLKRIQREHRDLWRHLYNSIATGYWCLYDPSEDIQWSL
jgi:hypothetical protein